MAEITPELQQKLELLANISDTASTALGRLGKTTLSQELMEKRLIKQLETELGIRKEEAESITKAIKEEEKRQQKEDAMLKRREDATRKVSDSLQQLFGGFGDLAKSAIANNSAIYNSDKAFSGVTPVIQSMSAAFKTVTGAIGTMLSAIPYVGPVLEGAMKLAGAAADIAFSIKTQQLENAQKYVETYQSIVKAGVTFGGDMEKMSTVAKNSIGNMALYSKFIQSSSEDLSKLGGTLQQSAQRVTAMGKSAIAVSPQLLSMYGSMDVLDSALAGYASTLSTFGFNTAGMDKELNKSSASYLISLKELQSLTGTSAEQYKKEAEQRAKVAAYQQSLLKMGPEAGRQLDLQVSLIGKLYGKQAQDFAMESIARNGSIISETGQVFGSLQAPIARVVTNLIEAGKITDPAKAAVERARIIRSAEPEVQAFLQRNSNMYQLFAGGVQDSIFNSYNETGATLQSMNEKRAKFDDATMDSLAVREKMAAKDQTEGSVAYNTALTALTKFQSELDDATRKSLPGLGKTVVQLLNIQTAIAEKFGTDSAFTRAADFFIEQLDRMANKLASSEEERLAKQSDASRIKGGGANLNRQFIDKDRVRNLTPDGYNDLSAKDKGKLGETTVDFSGLNQRGGIRAGATTVDNKPAETSKQLVDFMTAIKSDGSFGDVFINSLRDDYHKGKASAHNQGKAVDFTPAMLDAGKIKVDQTPKFSSGAGKDQWYYTWNADDTRNYMDKIAQFAEKSGFKIKNLVYEDLNPENAHSVNGTTGPHFHMETYEKGGDIPKGKRGIAGEAGMELIDGPAHVTSASKTSEIFRTMNENLAQMINLLGDQNDYLEQIAGHTA